MRVHRPSVEGPDFARIFEESEQVVTRLEAANWDFATVPEVFAQAASADVLAKQMVHIHDGQTVTRVGRLVMGGVGERFNLMGPIPPHSRFRLTRTDVLDEIDRQLGSHGLLDFDEFRALGPTQDVEFYNYSLLYNLRDFVRWLVLHQAGCFPSTLEFIVRFFAGGSVIQNSMYEPARPSNDMERPAVMKADILTVSYQAKVFEWMDTPLYGGLNPDTILIENLLTPEPSTISHPHLELEVEGMVKVHDHPYYLRRFTGIAQKMGVRDVDVPPEGTPFAS
jgi:hypothetical protein